ncbi:glycosyltransferase family 9 protein [Formicincola oecophyllae]|uniref:Glycosyltransferase family 9 protein n=1 Tax=Formicincola oecophyllae TaxID=2558361 RepID=A0A4Y6U6E6_9PROT|nr:glycosyltransferase family 9 protein [Formicincola oecophyllae]QDH12919.1 glycosyltransferase family 9 protein [Formicincola oecophyllae]
MKAAAPAFGQKGVGQGTATKSVLFITGHRLGDVVMSTAALAGLAKAWPQARFTVACGPAQAALFAHTPFVEAVLPFSKQPRKRHWLHLWQATRHTAWHGVVDLRSSLLPWFLKARHRHSLRGGRRGGLRIHQQLADLGLPLGILPAVHWSSGDGVAAAGLLPTLPPGEAWLGLGPTAGTENKVWPAPWMERFLRLLNQRSGAEGRLVWRPVLFHGPGQRERVLAAPLRALLPGALLFPCAEVALTTTAAALHRCGLYVGPDSGLMHLAAAAGTPTLGLFGPSCASQYAPQGLCAAALCAPGAEGAGLVSDITPEHAVEAALALLAQNSSPGGPLANHPW